LARAKDITETIALPASKHSKKLLGLPHLVELSHDCLVLRNRTSLSNQEKRGARENPRKDEKLWVENQKTRDGCLVPQERLQPRRICRREHSRR